MIIEIPRAYIDISEMTVNFKTFNPTRTILVNKDWTEQIRQKYFITGFDQDNTGYLEWLKTHYREDGTVDLNFIEGDQSDDDNTIEYTLSYFNQIDSLPYRSEFIAKVIEKEAITLRDITVILAKRYRTILKNKIGIDDKLGKTSNSNLLWMVNELLDNDSIPYDKANRWIGFIQGCMAMKGYIDVDEERDFSREYFHEYYKQHGMSTTVLEDK